MNSKVKRIIDKRTTPSVPLEEKSTLSSGGLPFEFSPYFSTQAGRELADNSHANIDYCPAPSRLNMICRISLLFFAMAELAVEPTEMEEPSI